MSVDIIPMICYRKDWPSIANAFKAAGYKPDSNICYSRMVVDCDGRYSGRTWFDLTQDVCYIYKYEEPHSAHNDLNRPRFYHTKGPENFSRFELKDLVDLINSSAGAEAKWNAWLRNYENEKAIEALP